jgi:hypothetical protein
MGIRLFDQHMEGVDLEDEVVVTKKTEEFAADAKAFLLTDVPAGGGSKGGDGVTPTGEDEVDVETRAKQIRGERKAS